VAFFVRSGRDRRGKGWGLHPRIRKYKGGDLFYRNGTGIFFLPKELGRVGVGGGK